MSVIRYARIPGKRIILTKKMIEDAISQTKSNAEAARWLGVSYNTYKKYAKIYNIFEQHKNQGGIGVPRNHMNSGFKLDEILNGKYPDYPTYKLKKRLISSGYLQEECKICGWNESRIIDDKICLHLDYIDSNEKNKSYDNLRLLCPNCYFTNVGNFKNSKLFC